jgi:hypothetical protein
MTTATLIARITSIVRMPDVLRSVVSIPDTLRSIVRFTDSQKTTVCMPETPKSVIRVDVVFDDNTYPLAFLFSDGSIILYADMTEVTYA